MTEVEQKFEAWAAEHLVEPTITNVEAFHAGYAAGAESMRARAVAECKAEEQRVMGLEKTDPELGYPYAGEACCMLEQHIRALSLTPEENTETQKPETENLPK